MRISLILLVALVATLMVCEFTLCTFSSGTTIFDASSSDSINSTPFSSVNKAVVTVSLYYYPFTCNLDVQRNGNTFTTLYLSGSASPTVELIPEKDSDVFTIKKSGLTDLCRVSINLSYQSKTDLDLPSSPFNLNTNTASQLLSSYGDYKLLVPKGKKVTCTSYMYADSRITITTSVNTVYEKKVGFTLAASTDTFTLVARSDANELFTISSNSVSTKIDTTLLDTAPGDVPSRNVQQQTSATPNVAGIVIGVIVGIIACCCITCIVIAVVIVLITRKGNARGGGGAGVTVVSTGATGTSVISV